MLHLVWTGLCQTSKFHPAQCERGWSPTKTPYNPAKGYSDDSLAYAYDFNGDTWADILVVLPRRASVALHQSPREAGDRAKHNIFDVADGESPDLKDMNGDGKPELLVHSSNPNKPKEANGIGGGQLGYAEIDGPIPTKARFRPITPKSPRTIRNTCATLTATGRAM